MSIPGPFGAGFEPPVPPSAATPIAPAGPEGAAEKPAVLRSIGWCLVLLVASFGLWAFAWVWHVSREVTPRVSAGDEGLSAGLRTALWWVPILNYVIGYLCWRDISRLAERSGVGGFSAGWYLFGYIVVGILLGPVALVFPCLVQDKLNRAWSASSHAVKAPMMRADWIPVGVGITIWITVGLVAALAPSS